VRRLVFPVTAIGPQPEQSGESFGGLARLGFGAAAITASGFIPFRGGRLWDPYLSGIRTVETGFPGAILRTFRVSEFLSPLESWNKLHVPQQIMASGGKYADFLQSMYGAGIDDVTLRRTGSIFGEVSVGGRAVGMGLQIRAGTQKGSAIADYYARLTGVGLDIQGIEGALRTDSLNDALLRAEWSTSKTELTYKEWLKVLAPQDRRKQLIIGARYREKVRILGQDIALSTRMQRGIAQVETTGKLLRAKAASTAGRLNILLSKPLELPVIGEALSKIPIIRSMAVKPGSATQILGRFAKKALIAGAAFKGLEYYDYLRSASSPWATVLGTGAGAAVGGFLFKKTSTRFSSLGLAVGAAAGLYASLAPRFNEGLFYGVASVGADVNLARARMSEATGLTRSLQEQERVSPGLISLKTALGFGGVGALGLGFYRYSRFLGAAAKEKFASKVPWADAFESVRDITKDVLGDKFWGTRVGKRISKLPGGKLLSKARGPMALGFLGGIAAWGVASTAISLLSGNLGAALPGINLLGTTETPEELEAIYSGEQEVAIRKGRFWEFGRSTKYEGCLTSDSTILMADGTTKKISEIVVGDKVFNSNGNVTTVLDIASRKINEEVVNIYSQWDRNDATKVTKNHEILACKIERCEKQKDCFCAPKVKKFHCYKCRLYKHKSYVPKWVPAKELTRDHALFIPEISSFETIQYINVSDCLPDNYLIDNGEIYVKANNCSMLGDRQVQFDKEILDSICVLASEGKHTRQQQIMCEYNVSAGYIKNRLYDLKRKRRKTKFGGYKQIDIWPETLKLDYDFGMLIGYYASEGNIDKDCGTVSFSFHKDEIRYINDVCRLLRLLNCTSKTKPQPDTKGVVVNSYSTILKHILSCLCPGTARNGDKQLNPILLGAPNEFLDGFLEAFINGDGSPKPDKCHCNIGLSTPILLKQIQLIMAYRGICSNFNKRMVKSIAGQEKKYKSYELSISGFDAETLYALMRSPKAGKHTADYKGAKKIKVSGGWLLKVREIEIINYNGDVWDIQVEDGNSFMSSGMVLHNSRIEYYRPHMLHRLKTRAYEKGLYGSEEEHWEYDPLLNPLKALFGSDEWKYHYEQKYQYERPAPLTATYGEDIPFIGPVIAATFGKLIKPRKLVRPEEWALGGEEYLHRPDVRGETEPAYGLGGLGPGAPVAPEEGSQLFNELLYRRREAVGLIGFAEGAIQKALTGREEMYQNLQTLGTMGRETGSEYWLWSHLNVGGALGISEPVRRFIPHRRSYLETYNPLANTMPSWLPDDYFLDLKYGNPFDKIKEAELRLPGPGYEAIHPEVEGLDPERYPLAHRLKILGDVAMWSDEYKHTLAKAKKNIHLLSDQEKSIVRTTEQQVKSKKVRREFDEYRFDADKLMSQQVMITDVLSPKRIKTAEFGDMVVDLQGMGAVTNMQQAMEFAKNKLQDRKVTLMMPSMESRRFDMVKSGGRLKAVAMLGDMDYGQAMAEEGLAQTKELSNEFEQIRFSGREKLAGQLSEQLLRGVETPIEMLTPMSPASKLIRRRSAIEEYVASEAIGTGNAFWDRPIENFLRPAADMALYSMGFDRIP